MLNAVPSASDHELDARSGTTRDVYRKTLLVAAKADARIVCVDSDMGGLEGTFGAHLPDQYVNVGIAEADLIGVSAGIAAMGMVPFANTMSSFATARACEQVKLDVAMTNLPVRIVGTHAGFSAGHYGPSHHAVNDLAIMRSMPNMTVIVPVDTVETANAVAAAIDWPGPVFIRLGRGETPRINQQPHDFRIGRSVTLAPGDDVTIIAVGPLPVAMAAGASRRLASRGVGARVINMHTIRPIDTEAVLRAADQTAGIVTVEDHLVTGGLGSAVCEIVCQERPVPVFRLGVPEGAHDWVGGERDLLAAAGITEDHIVTAAMNCAGGRPWRPRLPGWPTRTGRGRRDVAGAHRRSARSPLRSLAPPGRQSA
jgi:transketolase